MRTETPQASVDGAKADFAHCREMVLQVLKLELSNGKKVVKPTLVSHSSEIRIMDPMEMFLWQYGIAMCKKILFQVYRIHVYVSI